MTNDSLSDVVKADVVDILLGKDYFYDELLGRVFALRRFPFFRQILPEQRNCIRWQENTLVI